MKQTLLLVAAVLLLASCNNSGGDAEMHKKRADSLEAVVATLTKGGTTQAAFTGANPASDGGGSGSSLQQFDTNTLGGIPYSHKVDTATANEWIQAFHKTVKEHMPACMSSVSSMIDVRELNFLTAQTGATQVVCYIAKQVDTLRLIFVAAVPDGTGKVVEMPVKFTGTTGVYVMDQVSPCPTCAKVGIHGGKPITVPPGDGGE